MRLHELTKFHARKKATRVGRGISAGGGKTAGRGTKGQKSRTGANSNIPRTFDGGATSMIERLPKLKGFTSHRTKPFALNMSRLMAKYEDKAEVTLQNLLTNGIITPEDALRGVKIVGSSAKLEKSFSFAKDNPKLTVSKKLAA